MTTTRVPHKHCGHVGRVPSRSSSRDATDEDETDEHQTYYSALDGVIMTVLIPSQQLPADVTDNEHWTTFLLQPTSTASTDSAAREW